MKKKMNRNVSKSVARPIIVSVLRRVANALESGKEYTFQVKNDHIYIPVYAIVSLKHERIGRKKELGFHLK